MDVTSLLGNSAGSPCVILPSPAIAETHGRNARAPGKRCSGRRARPRPARQADPGAPGSEVLGRVFPHEAAEAQHQQRGRRCWLGQSPATVEPAFTDGADQNSNPRAPFDGRVMRWGNYPEWSPGHAEDQVCQNVTGLSAAFFALPARPEIHGSPPTGNRRRSVADCPQFTPGNT